MITKRLLTVGLAVAALATVLIGGASAGATAPERTYRVTLTNLTDGQPFSPGVIATHRPNTGLFSVGELAHPPIEAIAEDGNEAPAVAALSSLSGITDIFDLGHPLTPNGVTVGTFTDSVTFEIGARPGDRLSLVTMLICTNDGFVGLDSGHLPANGSSVFMLNGYDAGTEDNTEASEDIVDPCSGLGPVPLAGDPDGNDEAGVDSEPHVAISHHPGIDGGSDLDPAEHGWTDPVATLTVERID